MRREKEKARTRGREAVGVTLMRRFLALAGALLLSLAPATAQPQPVTIDVIISATGSNAFVGESYGTALRVLEQMINKTGGIQGRPLHFDLHDDQSSVAQAVQIATQLIAKHPAVVLGPAASGTCGAVAPLFINGPVNYCLSTAYTPVPRGFVFAAATDAKTYVGPASVRFMRLRGYRRLAIIDATDATGQSSDRMLSYVMTLPESRGLEYVDWEHFNLTDISIAAQAQRMLAAHPDAVITFAGGTGFGTVLRGPPRCWPECAGLCIRGEPRCRATHAIQSVLAAGDVLQLVPILRTRRVAAW